MMIDLPLPPPPPQSLVLCSGGLDSVVLAAYEARERRVQPVYVSAGLSWEPSELETLRRILRGPAFQPRICPPVELTFDVRDIYPSTHWAILGKPPAYDTADEDVHLVGRNLTLLSKAAVFAAQRKIWRIALGPLAGNPFPDATPEFFEAMTRSLSLGLGHDIAIVTPFLTLHKADVIKLGHSLGVPLELTLSCMSPTDGLHCGTCSKCRERRDAFDEAGVADKTSYAKPSPRG